VQHAESAVAGCSVFLEIEALGARRKMSGVRVEATLSC